MQRWMNQGTTMRFNDIEKDIRCCGKYGFDAIELKYNLVCHHELERIKELLDRNNVCAGSIGGLQLPVLREKEIERLMEEKLYSLCHCADILKAEYVVAIPPRSKSNANQWDIEEDMVRILERYSEIADGYGVKIAVEVTGFSDSLLNTVSQGIDVINQVKKKNLGLIYDFYHVMGMADLGKAVMKARAENIFIVHVNDGLKCTVGEYDDFNRLWPGDGDIDIAGQIGMLKAVGYRGPFSMEVYQPQMWPYAIHKCYHMAQYKMNIIEQFVSN